jgi:hypothetical protein
MYVVEENWHPVTRGLGESDVSRDDGPKNLCTEEAAKIGRYLLGQGGAVIIHGEENTLDGKGRIDRASQSHQGVKELGNTFQGQVFALNRNQD